MSGPSCAEYENGLRAGLASVRVELSDLENACAEYDPVRKVVTLDAFNGALLDGLIHELFHHCHYHRLAAWGAGEEPVTEALEDMVVRYINRSERRARWWRRALKAKLSEAD